MTETSSQPSVLSGAHANLPRGQGMPKLPTASLYPPDRIPIITDPNPEWQDWKYLPLIPSVSSS
jgi:hypothetical protein